MPPLKHYLLQHPALLLILFCFLGQFTSALPVFLQASSLNRRILIPKPVTPPPPPDSLICNPKCISHGTGSPEIPDDDEVLENSDISNDSDEKEDKTGETAGIIVGIVGGIVVVFGAAACWENLRRKKKRAEQERREGERELADQGKVEEGGKKEGGKEGDEIGVAV